MHCIKNSNVFFQLLSIIFFLGVILEYERHISVSQFWQRSGKQMMKIKEIKHDLEDMVCLTSLQKCFAAATSEVCLTWCLRCSSFALIPQSRHREKYLATTCCMPTNKKKVTPWNVLWENSPTAEDSYFNLLQDNKDKYFLLHLVSWINDHQRLLKEHESVVSLEGTRHIQSRNEGTLSF